MNHHSFSGNEENVRPTKNKERTVAPVEKNKNQFEQLQYVMQETDNSM